MLGTSHKPGTVAMSGSSLKLFFSHLPGDLATDFQKPSSSRLVEGSRPATAGPASAPTPALRSQGWLDSAGGRLGGAVGPALFWWFATGDRCQEAGETQSPLHSHV
jgi:hypothetical protein